MSVRMSTIKVSKDGTVSNDGTVIGSVKKVDPTDPLHIRGEGMGTRISFSTKPMWYAFTAEGTPLHEIGFDTRKRAVQRVENASKPLVVSDVKTETYMGDPTRTYVNASVSWEGNYASVSRYPGERAWVIDMYMSEGSFMPAFANGSGTRYTKPNMLQGPLHNAANAAAVAAGLLDPADAIEWDALIEIAKAEIAAKQG